MYPLVLDLEYRIYGSGTRGACEVVQSGSGQTSSISSGEVHFKSDRPLRTGLSVDLFIEWPASLSKAAGLTLRVKGRILKADENLVVLKMERYQFHTRPLGADRGSSGAAG